MWNRNLVLKEKCGFKKRKKMIPKKNLVSKKFGGYVIKKFRSYETYKVAPSNYTLLNCAKYFLDCNFFKNFFAEMINYTKLILVLQRWHFNFISSCWFCDLKLALCYLAKSTKKIVHFLKKDGTRSQTTPQELGKTLITQRSKKKGEKLRPKNITRNFKKISWWRLLKGKTCQFSLNSWLKPKTSVQSKKVTEKTLNSSFFFKC